LMIIATIDPIAFGQMTRSGSGALAETLRSAALEFIQPFRECVQDSLVSIGEEGVRQFINSDNDTVKVEGYKMNRDKFTAELSPKDVTEERFECNLVADRLRDEAIELSNAIQEVTYGLSSRFTAMQKHNLHPDPDREMDKIEQEKHAAIAAQDPVMHNYEMAKYYQDQGDEEMAAYHMTLAKKAIESTIAEIVAGQMAVPTVEEKKPNIIKPTMEGGRIQSEAAEVTQ